MPDWFDQHAPTQTSGDWFDQHPPATAQRPPDFHVDVKATGGLSNFVTGADQGPSVAGFLGNVGRSALEFGKNVVLPTAELAASVFTPDHGKAVELAQSLVNMAKHPGATGRLLTRALIERYGSIDAVLKTAYTDPVGAASDLSMVAGGASTALKGMGAVEEAATLGKMAEALNPLGIPAKVAESGGRAAYGAAINPSRRIRRGFGGAVDTGYKMNVLPTEGGLRRTETALEASAANTDALLAKADAAGAPKVTPNQITPAMQEPMVKAWERTKAGGVDERPALASRTQAIQQNMGAGVKLPAANRVKRQAQTLADSAYRAQERGAIIKDLDALADKNVAAAYQKAIETNAASVGVEGIKESNKQTQSLIGLAQALEDATQQPSRLTHLMATLGAIGTGVAGGMDAGASAYVAGRIATAKPVMAAAGIAAGKGGSKLLRRAQILRALAVLGAASADGKGTTEQQQAGH